MNGVWRKILELSEESNITTLTHYILTTFRGKNLISLKIKAIISSVHSKIEKFRAIYDVGRKSISTEKLKRRTVIEYNICTESLYIYFPN